MYSSRVDRGEHRNERKKKEKIVSPSGLSRLVCALLSVLYGSL